MLLKRTRRHGVRQLTFLAPQRRSITHDETLLDFHDEMRQGIALQPQTSTQQLPQPRFTHTPRALYCLSGPVNSYTVPCLRQLCRQQGLPVSGSKSILVTRIQVALRRQRRVDAWGIYKRNLALKD